MDRTSKHLSDEELRDFSTGRVPDAALQEQIAEHLGTCGECEGRLELLRGDDPILQLLREPDPLRPLIESGKLTRVPSLISTSREPDGGDAETGGWQVQTRTRPRLPERIGPYFIIEELASGGFGTVYLARDDARDRCLAIKLPHANRFATRSERDAFLNEARKAMRLEHPHIVPVYDCQIVDVLFSDHIERERCIIVMKYIEGKTLAEVMPPRWNHEHSAEIIAAVADALDYAHRKGFVHRDVKPSNILLDKAQVPYLADFGLALHDDEKHLHESEIAGTYPYMSPEQLAPAPIDQRADVWSLGVMLYELLTRKRPFRGGSAAELRRDIARSRPKLPRLVDDSIPQALEEICLRCLARNPEERFSTASDLARALRAAVHHPECPAVPALATTTVTRAHSWASLGLVVLAALILGIGLWWSLGEAKPPDRAWRRALGQAPREVIWPGYRGVSTHAYTDSGLSAVSNSVQLLRLGEHDTGRFRFSIKMQQADWRTDSGIFFGYHLVEYEGDPCATFQLVWLDRMEDIDLQRPPSTWRQRYYVRRAKMMITPTHASLVELMDLGAVEVPQPTDRSSAELEIELNASQLESVRWRGDLLPALTDPERAARTGPKDFQGPWGLFLFYGSGWFDEPRLQHLKSEE